MKKIILILLVTLSFASCTNYNVDLNVNSKNNMEKKANKVYLINANFSQTNSSYYENEIKKAFISKGLEIVNEPSKSELLVFYTYGMTEPFQKTVFLDGGDCVGSGGGTKKVIAYYNYISFTGIETKTYKPNDKIKPVVKSYVSYYSATPKFKTIFPALLKAITPYLGKDLDEPITITTLVGEEDKKEEPKSEPKK